MKNLKTLVTALVILTFNSCTSEKNLNQLEFLIGTWKVENKETYESWERINSISFRGESYGLVEGDRRVTETLSIHIEDDNVTYKATVPTQNNGETIPFILNTSNTGLFSFENVDHDFPKKIQYEIISEEKLLVHVLGESDQGFSYYLVKQK